MLKHLIDKNKKYHLLFLRISLLALIILGTINWIKISQSFNDNVTNLTSSYIVLLITTILVFKILIILYEKKDDKPPISFKPTLKWQYDLSFWKSFKQKEYDLKRKKLIDQIFYAVIFSIPLAIINDFPTVIDFVLKAFWCIFILISTSFIKLYALNKKEKKIVNPTIAMNSSGFMINNTYYPVEKRSLETGFILLEIKKKHDILCFHHFSMQRSTEHGKNTLNINTEFYAPIPSNKIKEVSLYLKTLKKELLGSELIENYSEDN